MELTNIKEAVDEIENENFQNSLKQSTHITELIYIYKQLINLKEQLFNIRVQEVNYKEYEDVRFKVAESIINVRIGIKQRLNLDYSRESENMKLLWNLQ
ncbi:MAG: hypothetical protein GX272_00510 [Epulopiscium sp.]|nr:hypothetical protein [Candidatus Epulonipiscium sp.]